MPAVDQCHEQVVRALQKDGWRVSAEHFRLRHGNRRVYVDLQLTRAANGRRQQTLLVEVKCFPEGDTILQELYTAVGQYLYYRTVLSFYNDPTPIYLSVPEMIFTTEFDAVVQQLMRENQIKLVVINLDEERVVQWIETWT